MKSVSEHIVKVGSKFRLVSKSTGKNLGTYDSKAGAEKRERQVQYFKHMSEDAPTNSVGGGAVAGIGVPNPNLPNQAEPGIKRKKFAGSTVFKVPTKSFVMAKMLKRKGVRFESYLGDPDIAREVAEYANKNWHEAIILEDEQTGAMVYLRYGKGNR
jgi:hypothetical protein